MNVNTFNQFYLKKTFYGNFVKNTLLPFDLIKNNEGNKNGIKGTGKNEIKLRHNTIRTKTKLIQKAIHNFTNVETSFITLTYKENMQDVKQAKLDLQRFLKKLLYWWNSPLRLKWKKRYGELKYFYVYEYQFRGAVHFHMVFNSHQIKEWMIEQWWKHGEIWAQDIRRVSKKDSDFVIKYLSKYVSKTQDDIKAVNQKDLGIQAYAFSRNCKKPKIVKGVIELTTMDIVNSIENATHYYLFKGANENKNEKNTFLLGISIDSFKNQDSFTKYKIYNQVSSLIFRHQIKKNLYNYIFNKNKGFNDIKVIGNFNNFKIYKQENLFNDGWHKKGKMWEYLPKKRD